MRTILRQWLVLLFVASVSGAVQAQTPAPKLLTGFVVHDRAGQQMTADALQMESNWALVVIDADLPSAQALLSALSAKETLWGEKVSVLLLGNESQALIKEIEANPKLANVRVLTAADSSVLRALDLPGLPAVLGIRSNRQIAWTRTGVPTEPVRMDAWLAAWTRSNPVGNQ